MSRLWVRLLLPHSCFPSHTTLTKGWQSKVSGLCVIGIAPWLRQSGPLRHFDQEPRQATAPTELCRQSCHAVGPLFASPSNTEITSLAISQIPDWLQDRSANIPVEDNLGADVSVKSDLDVQAEAVPTICRCSTSTDTTCKNCQRKPGFQVCIVHDLERFATRS